MLCSNKERKVSFQFNSKHRLRSEVLLDSKGGLRSIFHFDSKVQFDSKHRLRSKVPLGREGSLRSTDLLRSAILLRSNKTQTLMYPAVS